MISEDARDGHAGLFPTVRGRDLLKDRRDPTGVFVSIVEFPQPLVTSMLRDPTHLGLEVEAHDPPLAVFRELRIRGPGLELRVVPFQFVEGSREDRLGLVGGQNNRGRGHAEPSASGGISSGGRSRSSRGPSHRARYSVRRAAPSNDGINERTSRP